MRKAITIAPRSVEEMYDMPEFHDLVAEYSAECAIDGMPKPEYKIESYMALQKAGALMSFAAFLEGHLIGFAVTVSPVIPHYGMTVTVLESIFVAKAHRKTGAGVQLLHQAEAEAAKRGSPGLLANSPHSSGFADALMFQGYKPVSVSFFRKFDQ